MAGSKTVIVTGASQGIGAAVTRAFLDRGYNVVATSLKFSGTDFVASAKLALVEGDISAEATAEKITQTAITKFGSIEAVVNNAGIFFGKPFTEYTIEDFRKFVAVNLEGFFFMTQRAVKQMLAQGNGGSVTTITAALADNPMAGSSGVGGDDHQRRTGHGHAEPGEASTRSNISVLTQLRRGL